MIIGTIIQIIIIIPYLLTKRMFFVAVSSEDFAMSYPYSMLMTLAIQMTFIPFRRAVIAVTLTEGVKKLRLCEHTLQARQRMGRLFCCWSTSF